MGMHNIEAMIAQQNIEALVRHITDSTFLLATVMLMIYIAVSTVISKWLGSIPEPKSKITKYVKAIAKFLGVIIGFIISLIFFRIATTIIQTSIFVFNV